MSPFNYGDAAQIANVERHLTVDRLYKYAQYTGFDRVRAFELYAWNSRVCSAFYMPLQALEIGLRNAMEHVLAGRFGPSWYDDVGFLAVDASGDLLRRIDVAKDCLRKRKPPCLITTPQLVTELTFGFWTNLLANRFEHSLWIPCLRHAFPNFVSQPAKMLPRPLVHRELRYLKEFRDRIAHHEPIFYRALLSDYRSTLTVCTWMYDDLSDWVELYSQTAAVIAARPRLGP